MAAEMQAPAPGGGLARWGESNHGTSPVRDQKMRALTGTVPQSSPMLSCTVTGFAVPKLTFNAAASSANCLPPSEFEAVLMSQGRHISPVLMELGWQRNRMWTTTGQYHLYWVLPALSDLHNSQLGDSN
jgi:hypothetical protein